MRCLMRLLMRRRQPGSWKKANNATTSSTSHLKKINSATALKHNFQDELANLSTQHCKEMLDREHLIADLQNTCDEKESRIVDL